MPGAFSTMAGRRPIKCNFRLEFRRMGELTLSLRGQALTILVAFGKVVIISHPQISSKFHYKGVKRWNLQ